MTTSWYCEIHSMRIVQIVSTFPPYRGGMGHVAQSFFQGLSARGHQCSVITPAYSSDASECPGVLRLRPLVRYGNAAFIPQLYGILRDIDLIHLHYPFYGGSEAVLLFRKLHPRIPLVVTYHMDVIGTGIVRFVSSLYRRFPEQVLLRSADVVTCSSLDYLNHSYVRHVRFQRRVELPFGTSYTGAAKSLRDPPCLLFVGGLDDAHYFKGVDTLLEALTHLPECVRLVVVGSGNRQSVYHQRARELQLLKRVEFMGHVGDSQLAALYASSDVTVLPSTNAGEAFGMVLIESMACGTPVVTSRLPGVRTVVAEGQTGQLAVPGDPEDLARQINSILSHPERYPEMSQHAIDRVNDHYRLDHCLNTLCELYRSLS